MSLNNLNRKFNKIHLMKKIKIHKNRNFFPSTFKLAHFTNKKSHFPFYFHHSLICFQENLHGLILFKAMTQRSFKIEGYKIFTNIFGHYDLLKNFSEHLMINFLTLALKE
jgi:hypothetical protein